MSTKNINLNLIAEWMQRFFAYYDSLLPIGSYEIIKRLQMWLNNPQCGHKEEEKFPYFFSEITIKASPSIIVQVSCRDLSNLKVLNVNIDIFYIKFTQGWQILRFYAGMRFFIILFNVWFNAFSYLTLKMRTKET